MADDRRCMSHLAGGVSRRGLTEYPDVSVGPGTQRIARDGIERVRLTLHDGSEVSAAVHDNTFLAVGLRDRPASVNWVHSLGAHRLTVPGQAANALAEEILGR